MQSLTVSKSAALLHKWWKAQFKVSLPMEVVEVPTLDAFQSRVSNWKNTNIIPPTHTHHPSPTSPILIFLCQTSTTITTAKTPSYRHQNNRHVDCGPLNERRSQSKLIHLKDENKRTETGRKKGLLEWCIICLGRRWCSCLWKTLNPDYNSLNLGFSIG